MKKIIGILLFVGLFIAAIIFFQHGNTLFSKTPRPNITIDGHTFSLTLAKTLDEKTKGLSGTDSLAENAGMLFLFDKPDYYGFWMKDMKYSLDFIYIRGDKIVTIVNDIPKPASNRNLPIFKPVDTADKVLEINGGSSRLYNFKVGDTVHISL